VDQVLWLLLSDRAIATAVVAVVILAAQEVQVLAAEVVVPQLLF
jgi:hypothetical protein